VYKKDNTAVYKSSLDANVLKLMHVNKNLKTLIIEMEGEFKEREFINLNTKSEFIKCF
jgi:molybdopterin-guanine dinucleotide biosynthesis protein A